MQNSYPNIIPRFAENLQRKIFKFPETPRIFSRSGDDRDCSIFFPLKARLFESECQAIVLLSQPQQQHNLNTAVGLDMKMTLQTHTPPPPTHPTTET